MTWKAVRQSLGMIGAILALVIPAAGQAVSAPAPTTTPTREPGRPALPVIGTIFEHRVALGLSAAQVETLERLSLGLVREAIRRQADLMITQVDLDVLLDPDPDKTVDVAAAEAKLREIERARTDLQLALVRAVESARATLTPEQRAMLAPLLSGNGSESELDPADDSPGAVRPAGLAPSRGGSAPRPQPGGGAAPRPQPGVGAAPRPQPGGGAAQRPPAGGGAPHPRPRPPDGRHPDGHRDAGRHDGGRAVVRVWPSFWWEPYWFYAPPPVIVEPPVYAPAPPGYWYYCQSAQAYYPYVTSCPEAWIPVLPSPQ
jgi:hypothetical protein